jgi:hypothetical protein
VTVDQSLVPGGALTMALAQIMKKKPNKQVKWKAKPCRSLISE